MMVGRLKGGVGLANCSAIWHETVRGGIDRKYEDWCFFCLYRRQRGGVYMNILIERVLVRREEVQRPATNVRTPSSLIIPGENL
jgi:hypothetical protein